MILFLCWVVFLVGLILSVVIAAVMGNRGERGKSQSERVASPTGEPIESMESMFDSDDAAAGESFDAVESFAVDEAQPADDFAAFDKEFK